MNPTRFLGVVLLAGGFIVLGMAYQQNGGLGDTKHLFTGSDWDRTTWMIVIGGLASVLGLVGLIGSAPARHGLVLVRRVFHRHTTRVDPGPGSRV